MSRQSNEIAYEVNSDHIYAINASIERKIDRNAYERSASEIAAKNYKVKALKR